MVEDIVLERRPDIAGDMDSASTAAAVPHAVDCVVADDELLRRREHCLGFGAVEGETGVAEDVVLDEDIAGLADEAEAGARDVAGIEVETLDCVIIVGAVAELGLNRSQD